MKVTYLLEFKGEKMLYVFDEDGICSYSPAGDNSHVLGNFFTEVLSLKSKPAQMLGAKVDYTNIGLSATSEVMSVTQMKGSDNILQYLKTFRDKYSSLGISLKRKEGILESAYNSPKRMTGDNLKKNGWFR